MNAFVDSRKRAITIIVYSNFTKFVIVILQTQPDHRFFRSSANTILFAEFSHQGIQAVGFQIHFLERIVQGIDAS